MPSTIHTPSEFDTYTPDIDDGVGSSGEGPKAKRLRLMDQGPKSYDIGILLKLDEVREKIFTSSGLFITEKVEEALTQDAIFNLLLDLEPTIDPCGVLQFQVLVVPSGGPTHDKMVSMFVNMGFFREGKGKVLNYRGYEELVTILTMRMGEWERYKYEIRNVPKDLRTFGAGKGKHKGKGKEKERSIIDSDDMDVDDSESLLAF